jgi:hypothetical protein
MKTLADFKRSLTVGSKWTCYHNLHLTNYGIRIVKKKQTNSVCFHMPDLNKDSWLDFPKASDIEINRDGEVLIFSQCGNQRKVILTYKKIEA